MIGRQATAPCDDPLWTCRKIHIFAMERDPYIPIPALMLMIQTDLMTPFMWIVV